MDNFLPPKVRELRDRAVEVAQQVSAPLAEVVDAEARWPEHSFKALGAAGLLGLHVPERLGGQGQGLLALAATSEALGRACPSSALCFAMHSVATAVIAAKASPDQEERYLRPIAAGTHITTLSLSEPGTGSFFYLPQTRFQRNAQGFTVQGEKHFVTNGGYADSYVVSGTDHSAAGAGEFSMLLVDRDRPGLQWLDAWEGLGMRGNASRRLQLQDAPVPAANLLGEEGDQVWFVFEVVAPYFLMGMSGTYVGVAQALLDETLADVSARRYPELGQGLSELPGVQDAVADLWMQVQRARGLLYQAAQLGDWGTPEALLKILAAKVEATETAVRVADSVMRLGGGRAYRENGRRARLLRDALAGRVMAPTTELLKSWLGRSLLGLPWF